MSRLSRHLPTAGWASDCRHLPQKGEDWLPKHCRVGGHLSRQGVSHGLLWETPGGGQVVKTPGMPTYGTNS